MAETVIVRTAAGTFLRMDVPTAPHAVERWEQALAKGDLAVVDAASVVEEVDADGTTRLVAAPGAPADPEPKGGRKPKPEATTEDALDLKD